MTRWKARRASAWRALEGARLRRSTPPSSGEGSAGLAELSTSPGRWRWSSATSSRGVSDEALALADARYAIPMRGFSQSLNVSVAAAVTPGPRRGAARGASAGATATCPRPRPRRCAQRFYVLAGEAAVAHRQGRGGRRPPGAPPALIPRRFPAPPRPGPARRAAPRIPLVRPMSAMIIGIVLNIEGAHTSMTRLLVPLLLSTLALPALAQEAPPPAAAATAAPASPDDRPATQADVKALAEEVRRLKLELSVPDVIQFGSYSGAGPGASRVYHQPKGLSIGGYGEVVYTNYADDRADFAEVLRLVLYVGYRFNEMIVFNSEIEFEHGAKEIGIEMAYFDFLFLRRRSSSGWATCSSRWAS